MQGRKALSLPRTDKCKKKYKNFSVSDAVKEAESMLKVGIQERLEKCVYKKLPSKASTAGKGCGLRKSRMSNSKCSTLSQP